MPKLCLEIPNTEENITRPLAMSVVRQLAKEIGIPSETQVRFTGTGGSLPLVGSTLDDKSFLPRHRLPGDANITIEVDEEYSEAFALNTPTFERDQPAVFYDGKLGIALWPIKQVVNATVSFKVTASDKSTLDNWITVLKQRYTQGAVENYFHHANYHYPIPTLQLIILLEIHKLRENNQGYGENFGQWWRSCANKFYTVIRDQAGKNDLLCIKEDQIGIMGHFDFADQPPKAEKENDSGRWTISFNYIYTYDRITNMVLTHPILVHNQVLNTEFYNTAKPFEIEDYIRLFSVNNRMLREFTYESHAVAAWKGYPGIPVPYFDDWLPASKLPFTNDVFRFMIQLDPTNRKALVSLSNLGSWKIIESAMRYLRAQPLTLTQPFENVFSLALYRDGDLLNRNKFIVTPELDIFWVEDLEERDVHHLLMSMVIDITKLSTNALRLLCQYGDFAITYLTVLYPGVPLPKLNEDGTINFYDLLKIVEQLNRIDNFNSRQSGLAPRIGWNLVNFFTISLSRRKEDATN